MSGRSVIVVCQKGLKLSQGVAAWLRHIGIAAERSRRRLRGLGRQAKACRSIAMHACRRAMTAAAPCGSRAPRPKIDRIACPWLIRRFIDPSAVFLFVAPSEVAAVAERFGADALRHRGYFLEPSRRDLHLRYDDRGIRPRHRRRLQHLATIVRGADTGAPRSGTGSRRAAGRIARLSRMYEDDLASSRPAWLLYDAFYRWCRDATEETHNWPTNKIKP